MITDKVARVKDERGKAAGIIALVCVGVFWIVYLSGFLALIGGSLSAFLADLIWSLLSITAIGAGWYAVTRTTGTWRRNGFFAMIIGILQLALLGLAMFITAM